MGVGWGTGWCWGGVTGVDGGGDSSGDGRDGGGSGSVQGDATEEMACTEIRRAWRWQRAAAACMDDAQWIGGVDDGVYSNRGERVPERGGGGMDGGGDDVIRGVIRAVGRRMMGW